ncbi:hypothetical protein OPT61_g194 [Boeremia exigua]|uniref:Uncharacterized protein n=1 Tax=Boeremia exigua TaxID=749465 RepID=A0ACC2IUT0_9PLEO|nr:hypothetical protein OPT61_g194 [Boeremia exigua]
MRKKPSLKIDVSLVDPPSRTESGSQKSKGREHTNYVDLVRQLRNPTAAGSIVSWMETGRAVGRPISTSSILQKPSTPQRLEPKSMVEDTKASSVKI